MLGAASQGNTMRYVGALLAGLWCGCVWAQDCSALRDDERATCNAVQQNNPRFCEDVKVADVRLMCQAKVQPNSYTCEKIKAANLRGDCLQMIRKKQYDAIYPNPTPKPKNGEGMSGWGGN
jgi:hypothetical protein